MRKTMPVAKFKAGWAAAGGGGRRRTRLRRRCTARGRALPPAPWQGSHAANAFLPALPDCGPARALTHVPARAMVRDPLPDYEQGPHGPARPGPAVLRALLTVHCAPSVAWPQGWQGRSGSLTSTPRPATPSDPAQVTTPGSLRGRAAAMTRAARLGHH